LSDEERVDIPAAHVVGDSVRMLANRPVYGPAIGPQRVRFEERPASAHIMVRDHEDNALTELLAHWLADRVQDCLSLSAIARRRIRTLFGRGRHSNRDGGGKEQGRHDQLQHRPLDRHAPRFGDLYIL
jgi:hypothetical protein